MEELFKLLNSKFILTQIKIHNFSLLEEDVSVEMKLVSEISGEKNILFENVTRININSEYYSCSERSSILIQDISTLQWEKIMYKVSISEEIMTFYCENILLK